MIQDFVKLCQEYPQIAIFLSLAVGYYIGKIKIFGFCLGSTAGVLVAALFVGQMNVDVPPLVKTISFAFFIFAIGYKVGPQFFGALKKEGLNYIWISIFFGIVGLITAVLLGKFFGFDKGTTAGMLAGALTQSSAIGTAEGAIKHLAVSSTVKATLESNVAIAYAITYVFGTAGLVLFFKMVPRLLGINLKEESKKLEKEMGGASLAGSTNDEIFSWYKRVILRGYKATTEGVIGKTVSAVEAIFPDNMVIERIVRSGETIDSPGRDVTVEKDDEVVLVGPRKDFLNAAMLIGPEVDDKDGESVAGEILDVCVLNKEIIGKTLGQIGEKYGHKCFLRSISRQGHELPLVPDTVINKCDMFKISGSQKDVEEVVKHIGFPERPTATTDLVMVGLACMLGTLIGLIVIPVAGVPVTLGVGGGILVSGLVFGWLRSLHPTFGQIPNSVQWIFTDLGLNLFIACVGLFAAPRAVHALKETGIALFFAGAMLTLIPHILGLLFGRFVLKLNPVLLFGSLTGAGTITAALNALKEEADSAVPTLAYTVPYAFGNVILTIWGTLIIHLM